MQSDGCTPHHKRMAGVQFNDESKLIDPLYWEHSPSVNSEKISDSKELKKWVDNYLGVGEWVMDQSVAILSASSWFERKR